MYVSWDMHVCHNHTVIKAGFISHSLVAVTLHICNALIVFKCQMSLKLPKIKLNRVQQTFSIKYILLYSNILKTDKACMEMWQLFIRILVSPNHPIFSLISCVATLQSWTSSWYLCRWTNIHRAVGMSGMPLFMGGRTTHPASCVSLWMSHVVALAPQCFAHHGTCPLACLPSSLPLAGSPYLFKY